MNERLFPLLLFGLLLPAPGAAEEGLATVPLLVARDIDDKKFELPEQLKEGPVLLTFWATWCKPCRQELPRLQVLQDIYGEQGFRVVGVNGDGPIDQSKIRPYVKASGFSFTVLLDPDGRIRKRFQVEVFPTSFLISSDGRLLRRQVGYRQGDEKILEAELRSLLGLEDVEAPEAVGR